MVAAGFGVVGPTRASSEVFGSASTGSAGPQRVVTIDRPDGLTPGHVMVASVVAGDSGPLAAPPGWSLVSDDAIPGTLRQAVYLKVAGSAEPPDYTWTAASPAMLAGGITAYSGVDTSDPIDARVSWIEAGDGPAPPIPPITTSADDTRLVRLTAVNGRGRLTAGPDVAQRWEASAVDAGALIVAGSAGPEQDSTGALASGSDWEQPAAGPVIPVPVVERPAGPAIGAVVALRPAGTGLPGDSEAPETTVDAGPPAEAGTTAALFTFSADEPASFTCRLDDEAPAACSSPLHFTGLAPGPHRVTVAATDPAGNTDRSPAVRRWHVAAGAAADSVLVGAGDIADCRSAGDEATAALVAAIPGTVFTAGDNAYVNGTPAEFNRCYGPTWGKFKGRTMPAVGNHEYQQDPTASGYYRYFGAAAGDPAKGYYDYTLGSWHVVVLNSNCEEIGGCGAGSPQERWLRRVLAAGSARCTVAITHHARFSSAIAHGSDLEVLPLWQALYDYGADLVVSGHDHVYERFGPQRPNGVADPRFGLRQIVVGTGGRDHRNFGPAGPSSEIRNGDTFGVLKLTLHADSYDWQFVPEADKTFTDAGTTACHGAPRLRLAPAPPIPSTPSTTVPPPPTTVPTPPTTVPPPPTTVPPPPAAEPLPPDAPLLSGPAPS
jgi:hypothetical protein